jgi:Pectate lyase superfamily protein
VIIIGCAGRSYLAVLRSIRACIPECENRAMSRLRDGEPGSFAIGKANRALLSVYWRAWRARKFTGTSHLRGLIIIFVTIAASAWFTFDAATARAQSSSTTIAGPTSQTLTDAQGNVWSLGALVSKQYGYAVLRNGDRYAGGLAVQLTVSNGVIWALNGANQWYMSDGTTWTAEAAGLPASTIVGPTTQTVTDAQGNVWSLGALVSKQYGYAVLRNRDQYAGGLALQLTLSNGVIWASNGANQWYMNNGTTWAAEAAGPSSTSTPTATTVSPNGTTGSTVNCANFDVPPTPLPSAANAMGEEFVGPFASWADLKRDYGAKGDGVSDDTAAIQNALNNLSNAATKSPVLYMPAGTYLVTQTLTVQSAQSIGIIGQDPSTTTLKWGGSAGGTLLHINAVAYSRFDRITFDGSSTAGVLVDQSAVPNTAGGYFDTGNEYTDDVFKNGGIGIQGGQYGIGAAESSVLRSQFLNQTTAGIILKNFNALDWWIWYSFFQDNDVGITNNPGAGNFHAFNNVFNSSTFADLSLLNTGNFNFRNNFSSNSLLFLYEAFYYTNAAVTSLQGNTVITTSTSSGCGGCSIYQGNMGPTIMTDNTFVSPPGTTVAVAIMAQNPPDCVSVGNTYTQNNTIQCGSYSNGPGRLISVDDQVVAASSVNETPPTLPGVPPNLNRQIFDVAAGSHSAGIQQAVSHAAALCGNRPVVHLPYGSYALNQAITIPANCDLQLVGDGGQTVLTWAGSGPAIVLQGPSRAILRDFYVNAGTGIGIGIEVRNADQPGSRIYMQQPMVLGSLTAGIFVDGLDYAFVELEDTQIAGTGSPPASTGVGLLVAGGPLAQQGNPQSGRTNLFAGSGGANYLSYQASGGANLVVRDAYYEWINASTYGEVSDNSSVTFEGSRMATANENGGPPTSLNAIQIDNLSCTVAVMTSAPDTPVAISGSFNGNAWVVGNNFGESSSYSKNIVGTVGASFNLNRSYNPSSGSNPIPDPDPIPASAFIRNTLAQSRAASPSQVMDLAAGVTDARFYRVTVNQGSVGIHLTR